MGDNRSVGARSHSRYMGLRYSVNGGITTPIWDECSISSLRTYSRDVRRRGLEQRRQSSRRTAGGRYYLHVFRATRGGEGGPAGLGIQAHRRVFERPGGLEAASSGVRDGTEKLPLRKLKGGQLRTLAGCWRRGGIYVPQFRHRKAKLRRKFPKSRFYPARRIIRPRSRGGVGGGPIGAPTIAVVINVSG